MHARDVSAGLHGRLAPTFRHGQAARLLQRIALHAVVAALAVAFVLPFLWLLAGSLKSNLDFYAYPPRWIPSHLLWSNYPDALGSIPYLTYLRNTLEIAGGCICGALLSNTLIAYGFARVQWPGRNVVFFIVVSTLMLPSFATLIPLFVIYSHLGWVNTYRPLIVPSFFGYPFFIFLLRQFFLTIPLELSDAARIDGCSELSILWRIVVPLSRPALAMVALFQFNWTWSDYLNPLVYLNDADKWTLALGMQSFLTEHGGDFGLLMAATTVTLLPVMVLFFFAQRTFIEGITLTGIKG